ncbi:MAG: glycosyltransferase family 39 protein, partial [Chloroflexota bacterium]
MKKLLTWPTACVLLITAVSALPLFGQPVKGDDLLLHYYRIAVVNAFWEEGVFFSRWAPDLLFGYGSPLFNFYPPLSAYLLTIFYWLVGANGPVALNVFSIVVLLLTSSGMYLAASKLFGSFGGVLSTAVYCWSPFLLLQTYSRSSLSNALALALFPWAFWALLMLYERLSWRWLAGTAVLVSSIFLSHVVSSTLFIAPFIFMGGVMALLEPVDRKRRLSLLAGTITAGLGLSAFFMLPAFGEIESTKYAEEAARVDYTEFFADAWRWPEQSVSGVSNAPLPKTVGLVQQWAAFVALIGTSIVWWRNRNKTALVVWFCMVIGFSGLFLTMAVSNFVWEAFTPLQGVQFPWRLLDIPVFWLAFGLGWLGSLLQFETHWWEYGAIFVLLAIMVGNATPFLSPPTTAVLEKRPLLSDASRVEQQFGIYGLTAWGEYSSSTVDSWPRLSKTVPTDRLVSLAEKMQERPNAFQLIKSTPWELRFHTTNAQPIELPMLVHFFPGWQLTIDGQPARIGINAAELMVLTIPSGSHSVSLAFGQTPLRAIGNGVTLVTLVVVMGLTAVNWGAAQTDAVSTNRLPVDTVQVLAILLGVVLMMKVGVIDQITTPLLRQRTATQIESIPQPTARDFGEIALLGSEVVDDEILVLYWQAKQVPTESYRVVLTLLDGRGVPVKEIRNLHPGFNRTSTWEAGQVIRDVYTFPEALEQAPVAYDVLVSLEPEFSEERLPLQDSPESADATWAGLVKRGPDEAVFGETAVSQNANFNNQISLIGLDREPTVVDNTIQFGLIWQSERRVDINYTVFVHLLDENNEIVEQSDGQPTEGIYPTAAWAPNEQILDRRHWVTSAPSGNYRLQIGLYDLQTGVRLPVTGEGALGDRVIISQIVINGNS